MWRITLKSVAAHRLRYALTALAVLLGVAFIASYAGGSLPPAGG